MRISHFNDEFLVLLGPISRLFTCSNAKVGACSSPISMITMHCIALHTATACVLKLCCTPGTMPPTKYLIVLAVQLYQKLHMQLETSG